MYRLVTCALLLCLAAVSLAPAASAEPDPDQGNTAQDRDVEVLVEVDASADRAAVEDEVRVLVGEGEVRSFETSSTLAVTAPAHRLDDIRSVDGVAALASDPIARRNMDDSVPATGAPFVWARAGFGDGRVVAIVDDGVGTHPAFEGALISEACFTDAGCLDGADSSTAPGSGAPCDGCNHGTAIAGIASAEGPDHVGVAPGSNLMSVRVFGCLSGPNCGAFYSDIVFGLEAVLAEAAFRPIDAVNISLTFERGADSDYYAEPCDSVRPEMAAVVDQLTAAGVVVVAAAGNFSRTDGLPIPACLSNVIAVGATSATGVLAAFSNSAPGLDLAAPGTDLRTTFPGGGSTNPVSGTSFAAPHVTGAAALVRSLEPTLTGQQVRGLLLGVDAMATSPDDFTVPELALGELLDDLEAGAFVSRPMTVNGHYRPLAGNFAGDAQDELFWYAAGPAPDYLFGTGLRGAWDVEMQQVNGTYETVVGDFDGDGFDDIFWHTPNADPDYLSWGGVSGLVATSFVPERAEGFDPNGSFHPLVGDFTGDGIDDLFLYRPGAGSDGIASTGGTRSFTVSPYAVNGTYTTLAANVFAGGPGDADEIVFISDTTPDYVLSLDDGGSVFTMADFPATSTHAAADLDGDGADDVFSSGPLGLPDAVVYGTGDEARVLEPIPLSINGDYALVPLDVEGDDRDELLFVSRQGAMSYVLRAEARSFAYTGLVIPAGASAYPVDVGGLGRDDFLAYQAGQGPDAFFTSLAALEL